MIKIKRLFTCFLLSAVCLFQMSGLTIHAQESWPAGPEVLGEAAVVMEVSSGAVLYEKNAQERMYPASITKIMTALLALENTKMEEQVTFSYDSVHKTEGSGIWRDVDEVMTMEQCLYALMLNSANECAHAIAEHTGGSLTNFVQMMNERAAALGCANTHFNNPHGLPDEEHYTTAYDMALIAREAIKNSDFRQITGTTKYTIPPTNKHPDENTYLANHHKMLQPSEEYFYEYCIGGKTGYTQAAGNTLVTYAEKNGMTLVCVVMKEKTPDHYTDTRALLDYCFDNFRLYNIAENETDFSGEELPDCDYLTGEEFVTIGTMDNIVLPITAEFQDAEMKIVENKKNPAVCGIVQYNYQGRFVGQTDIKTTGHKVKEFPFQEHAEQETAVEQKTVKINVTLIIWIVLGLLAVAAGGFCVYRFREKLSALRFRFLSRKRERDKRVVIVKNRRRKRRKW